MGKRGAILQPTEIIKAKGYYRPSRHGNINDKPKLDLLSAIPNPPDNLNEVGAEFWHDMLHYLLKIKGLVTIPDLPSFQIMAYKYQTIIECTNLLKKQGKWVTDHNGNTKENPVCVTLEKAEKIFLQIATQFGMNPSARNMLKVEKEEKKEEEINIKL